MGSVGKRRSFLEGVSERHLLEFDSRCRTPSSKMREQRDLRAQNRRGRGRSTSPAAFSRVRPHHGCAGDPEWPHLPRSVLRPSQANLLQRWFLDPAFTVTFMSSNFAVCLLPDVARHPPVPSLSLTPPPCPGTSPQLSLGGRTRCSSASDGSLQWPEPQLPHLKTGHAGVCTGGGGHHAWALLVMGSLASG